METMGQVMVALAWLIVILFLLSVVMAMSAILIVIARDTVQYIVTWIRGRL